MPCQRTRDVAAWYMLDSSQHFAASVASIVAAESHGAAEACWLQRTLTFCRSQKLHAAASEQQQPAKAAGITATAVLSRCLRKNDLHSAVVLSGEYPWAMSSGQQGQQAGFPKG